MILFVAAGMAAEGSAASRPSSAPSDAYRHVFVVYGRLDEPTLRESSGLVASLRHPGIYWTHNDSNNPPQLFAVDEFGALIGQWWIDGAFNYDWEDITLDADGRLVVADTGDSRPTRVPQRLLVIDEPADPRGGGHLRLQREIPFRLPQHSHDCEALFSENGRYFVIDKRGSVGQPTRHAGTLYRLTEAATLGAMASAEAMERFEFGSGVTGAALSADGTRLAVSTYYDVFVFRRTPGGIFFTPNPCRVHVVCGQNEAVAFHHRSAYDLLLTCEQRMMYRLTREWYESGHPFVPMARLEPSSQPTTMPGSGR